MADGTESSEEDELNKSSDLGASLSFSTAAFTKAARRRVLKVVSVVPHKPASLKALSELESACKSIGAELSTICFQKLDFGELDVLDRFYSYDVAVVDASLVTEQSILFYHLGVRESFGMKDNVILVHDEDDKRTSSLQVG